MDAATANKEFFKEGRLRKEGGSVKTWKTRWCVIEDNHLLYYKNEKKKELKGNVVFIPPLLYGNSPLIECYLPLCRFHFIKDRK